ncbi:MAG: PDZ domain-containing protein [Candidatus Methanoperedens sp.]|nr:PDZ domain-containing protein [Candidatus Methanoperedens sp.]
MKSFDEMVTGAVEKVIPSVVNISEVKLIRDAYLHVHPVPGVGSGFVIREDGYILTNAHVVIGSHETKVTLENGKIFSGNVRGIDMIMDLAVVRIEADNLHVPEMAKDNNLRIGQMAIAIGSPLGLVGGPTVTVGVVSALERSIQTEVTFMEGLIQTDAAINPGNSGGPLINSEGVIIGINSAIIPFAQGIGFAIPIGPAMWIAEQLMERGEVIRPWISINAVDVNPKLVAYYNLPVNRGVVITKVISGSEADRSGIDTGDIIIQIDDTKINNVKDLIKTIIKHDVGDVVTIGLCRGQKKLMLDTRIEKAPSVTMPPQPA